MSAGPLGSHRLSLNQATVKHLDLAQSVDLCVRHQIPAIGLWRDRVAEAGLRPGSGHGPGRGPARVQPLPGRLLHPPGRAGPGQRPGGQPPGHRRGGRAGGGHPRPRLGRPAVRQPGPRPGPAHGRRRDRRPGPDRAAAGSAAGHRAHAPDVLRRPRVSCPGWATRSTWPCSSRPRRWEWWWTATTSGGTRSWPRRSSGPAAAWPASSCATGWSRSRRIPCSAAAISATA